MINSGLDCVYIYMYIYYDWPFLNTINKATKFLKYLVGESFLVEIIVCYCCYCPI